MSKYGPLEKYLKEKNKSHIPMTFSEIESVIGDHLPPSARKHRAWWSNNPSNSVITYAWLAAGYKTSAVNIEAEKLVFEKESKTPRPTSKQSEPTAGPASANSLFGCLKGLISLPKDVDLTKPADPDWGPRTYGHK